MGLTSLGIHRRQVGSESTSFYDGRRYSVRDSVTARLHGIVTAVRREMDRRVAEHGLTAAQWQPLWLLHQGLASTALELARQMHVDAGAITRMLDRLESKGLVERDRSAIDRRIVRLELTAQGRDVATRMSPLLAEINNELLTGFERAEWEQLCGLLDRVVANAAAWPRPGEAACGAQTR